MVVTSCMQGPTHSTPTCSSRGWTHVGVVDRGGGTGTSPQHAIFFFPHTRWLTHTQKKAKYGGSFPRLVRESVLEPVAQDEAQGKALTLLVGTGAGLGREDPAQLVKHPVLGGIEPLEMLLGSARHYWTGAGTAKRRGREVVLVTGKRDGRAWETRKP